jgi:hypothetical protein
MAINDYGVNFGGRRIVHPGGYDSIDATQMTIVTEGGLNVPIVIGKSDAGQPGVVKFFTGTDQARKYLRGGDLLKAMELMFSPTPEGGGGASVIGVVVANDAKQSTLTSGGLVQTSVEYGEGSNRVLARVEDGTIAGSKKYTVSRWDLDLVEVYNNLGAVIKLKYTGSSAYAAVTVTVTDGKAVKLETKVGADEATSTTDLSVSLTDGRFVTIDDLISYLSSVSDYEAGYVELTSSGLSVSTLDALAKVDIKAGGYLKAVKGDIEHRVNDKSELVTVSVTGTLTNFDSAYLTGGTGGTVPTSWSEYLDAIKTQFSDILVLLTESETIHAEGLSHVGEMLNRNQKQVMFVGGGVGETIDRAKQRAAALNNSRAVLAYPGIYHKANQGGKVPLPAYFTAALIAGRVAGVDASEPITFDYFSVLGLEKDMLAGDPEVNELLTSGVATLERVENGGFRLVQGITTWRGSNNVLYREISVRRGADKLSETVRKTLETKFVGRKGLRTTPSSVVTAVVTILEQAIKDGDILSYQNIVVRMENTVIYVDYEVAPTEPNNYVLITSHFIPESITATQ